MSFIFKFVKRSKRCVTRSELNRLKQVELYSINFVHSSSQLIVTPQSSSRLNSGGRFERSRNQLFQKRKQEFRRLSAYKFALKIPISIVRDQSPSSTSRTLTALSATNKFDVPATCEMVSYFLALSSKIIGGRLLSANVWQHKNKWCAGCISPWDHTNNSQINFGAAALSSRIHTIWLERKF